MSGQHHVFLVPGFFGFESLGDLPYFAHVDSFLHEYFASHGISAVVQPVGTLPTASLSSRAASLADRIAAAAGDDEGPIHLIGHSSGGLDVRLMMTPDVALPTETALEPIVARTKTVVTVATPHCGTPVASLFTSTLGQKLLQVLSLVTVSVLKYGRTPVWGALQLGKLLARLDDIVGLRGNVLDQLYDQLLGNFNDDVSSSVQEYLSHVSSDQSLLPQTTPAAMDVFNATTKDRPEVRYGCVVTRARPPGLRSTLDTGLDPYAQLTHALYQALYRVAAQMEESDVRPLTEEQIDSMMQLYGKVPDIDGNDGMVPTRSQVWGDILHIALADHADVMGYFSDPDHDPPHIDWLWTASGFNRTRFEALWSAVGRYCVEPLPIDT